ncbi:MAG: nucleotidyltransferase domain-containing protein [Dorea sp.]|nr:nucleotidyltransferase domain-containing protein [Dorea sp.]
MLVKEVIQEVTELCRKHFVKKMILFGSRAKGTERDRSDIDIAVSGAKNFDLLLDEIDNLPTLYTIDVVNLDTCENPLLREDINLYGKKIYEEI